MIALMPISACEGMSTFQGGQVLCSCISADIDVSSKSKAFEDQLHLFVLIHLIINKTHLAHPSSNLDYDWHNNI